MHKLIDFSTKDSIVPVVVQPDFIIAGRTVNIQYSDSGTSYFRLSIGCQAISISKPILKSLIRDIEFPEPKALKKKVIVKKGSKPTKSTAKFGEESTSYYISEQGKVYSKSSYDLSDITYTEESRYFRKTGQSVRASAGLGYWYNITPADIENLKHIFKIMDAFFNPVSEAEPKVTKKKATK